MDKQIHEVVEQILAFTQEGKAYVDAYALKRAMALFALLEQLPERKGDATLSQATWEDFSPYLKAHVVVQRAEPGTVPKRRHKHANAKAGKQGNPKQSQKELPMHIRTIDGKDLTPEQYEAYLLQYFKNCRHAR